MPDPNINSAASHKFGPDVVLWLRVSLLGLSAASVCACLYVVLRLPLLWRLSHDGFVMAFMLPALVALGWWCSDARRSARSTAFEHPSETAYLALVLWSVLAIAVGFAQGYVGHAWLIGAWPFVVSIPIGLAALAPLIVWRFFPALLGVKEPR